MTTARLILLPFLLAACSATTPPPAELAPGRYDIVSIDGETVSKSLIPVGEWQQMQLAFGERSYGGDTGCNAWGGLFVRSGDRLYTSPGAQTAMACGDPTMKWENAANALFHASPTVSNDGDEIVLTGGGHEIRARFASSRPVQDPPTAWQSPILAGQVFVIERVASDSIPGEMIWSNRPPLLSFGSDRVTLRIDCPEPVSASFSESDGQLTVGKFAPSCPQGKRDERLMAVLEADPAFVTGPNGELLLGSAAGWASLHHQRRDRPK